MKALHVSEDIVPIAEFKAKASEVIRGLRAHGRPMIVTLNGKPAAVLVAPEDFDRLTERARFVAAVKEGLRDSDSGNVIEDADLGREIDRLFPSRSGRRRAR